MDLGKGKGWKIDWLKRLLNNCGIKTLQNVDQSVRDYGPWENLPNDIIEKIALQLNSIDYMHSSMVCKSWQSILLESDILRPQMPWLLFPHNSSSHNIKFYNILENKWHTFMLPKGIGGRKVIGCSKGWVIFMTKVGKKISLFNPIFGANYILPRLPTTLYLQRIELSSSNISNCIVAAIVDDFARLAFCKLGNKRWEVVSLFSESRQVCTLIDLLFCQGKLHVLINSNNGSNGKMMENININLPNDGEAIPITLIHDINYEKSGSFEIVEEISTWIGSRVFLCHLHISFLVESIQGRVMLVQKHFNSFYTQQTERMNIIHNNEGNDNDEIEEEDDDDHHNNNPRGQGEENDDYNEELDEDHDTALKQILSKLNGFKVYGIEDLARKERILKDLGEEQALFLSSKSRLCLPSVSKELKGNCVHFIMEEVNEADDQESYYMAINGIYHLDDLTIEPLISKFQVHWNPDFMWFAPNLQH